MKKSFTVIAVLSFLLASCAEPETISADKPVSVLDIISEAQAAHLTAIEYDHAWTKTSQLLASAKNKLAMGDESAARADAQRALFTANASVAQANREKNAWKGRVPYQ
jgi:hypothetical protein